MAATPATTPPANTKSQPTKSLEVLEEGLSLFVVGFFVLGLLVGFSFPFSK